MCETDVQIAEFQTKQYKNHIKKADKDLQMEFNIQKIGNVDWKKYIESKIKEY